MSKFLITGACGFIGSNFVHYVLSKDVGAEIIAVDNLSPTSCKANLDPVIDRIILEVADIRDFQSMEALYRRYQPDFVVNFAAESHNDRAILSPTSFIETNALGAQVLLEASRKYPVKRHVQVSTIEVYGELPEGADYFTESSPLNAKTLYSASKAAGDLFARAYMQTYNDMDIVVTHCANNYGPYQFPEKLLPVIISNVLSGQRAPIYGDGQQKRDWLHVRDHCRAIWRILNAPKTEICPEAATDPGKLPIFDISARNEMTNVEIATKTIKFLGKDPADWLEFVADRPNHDRRYLINPEKIESQIGWKPEIPFEIGLQETVNWYIENQDWWMSIRRNSKELQFDWSSLALKA
jgi:dTDP-glucose 4,6-dehydratase